jgi:predicted RNA binding protein YcfA (HicA-like mRNA interferase family)
MKIRDIMGMLRDDGWYLVAQRGSHRQYKHPVKKGRVTIAGHRNNDDLAPGTLNLTYSRIEAAPRCEARGVKLYSSVLRTPRTKQMGPDRFARRVKTP